MPVDEPYLTVDEVAAYYRKSKQTLYNWRQTGYGPPAVRIGRHLRYRRNDVENWPRTEAVRA